MTHHDEGNYRAKRHGEDAPAAEIMDAVANGARDGKIACTAAEAIATRLSVAPDEVGRAIDLAELKISACQLGLFGYGKGVKLIKPAESVAEDLAGEIRAAATDGRIACTDVWAIADRRGMTRLDAACACDALGLKIAACQLGAF
ncbi:MAG TPA: hypothetical protein PLG31_11960 [Spirochaetota bacterium]|nr:hypothetical protein [Spirochaetota bacterium]